MPLQNCIVLPLYKRHVRVSPSPRPHYFLFSSGYPKDTCVMALLSGFDVRISAYQSWRASLPPPETSAQIMLWWGGVGRAGELSQNYSE